MSANPGNTEPADAHPINPDPTGQDPSAKDPVADEKAKLQLAIFEVTRDATGKSQSEICDMLQSAFARHGVKSPAGTWLDSVASAAFYGEPYIIDLPAALAADRAVPAPTEEVRARLTSRRRLRKEKLPPGIFPDPTDWDIPENEVTYGTNGGRRLPGAVRRKTGRPRGALVMALLTAAAVVIVLAANASTRHLLTKHGFRQASTTRKGSAGGHW